jgi:hypothetical protein
MILGPALRDRQKVRFHLFEGDPGFKPTLVNEPVVSVGTIEFQRTPEVGPALGETLGHDSDQRSRSAIECEASAKDRGVHVEAVLPNFVAHDEDRGRARFSVFRRQTAAY